MDLDQIRTLNILDEIGRESTTSQRALSDKLNISLGLVNSFVKRLANKGYFKISTVPRNRVKYILTPKGAAEKSRLTYEYLKFSYVFYKNARNKILASFQEMIAQDTKKIVFYGAGELAEIAYTLIQHTPLELVAVVDADLSGKKILNKIVLAPDNLPGLTYDKILITGLNFDDSVFQLAERLKIAQEKIVLLF